MTALARYLAKHGVSCGALGRRVGVSSGVVSRWATGKRIPTLHFAISIARVTNGEVAVESWEEKPAAPPRKARRVLPRRTAAHAVSTRSA